MDIKTRIEDDTVLFDKFSAESRAAKVHSLNSIGIYTIEDFVNLKEIDFPKVSREFYWGMAHILRHEYLGEDIVYDALLEREYYSDYDGCKCCYSDMVKMGIVVKGGRTYTVNYMLSALEKHNKQDTDKFNIKWFIKNVHLLYYHPIILQYYLDFIEKNKKDNQPAPVLDSSLELNKLKIQLETLVSINNSLQKQIDEIQEKINKLEGGQSVHGK